MGNVIYVEFNKKHKQASTEIRVSDSPRSPGDHRSILQKALDAKEKQRQDIVLRTGFASFLVDEDSLRLFGMPEMDPDIRKSLNIMKSVTRGGS